MIIKAAIILILIIILVLYIFKDNPLKKNISKLWSLIIIGAILAVIVILLFAILKDFSSYGKGALFSDMVSMGKNSTEEEMIIEGDTLVIEIRQSELIIGDSVYQDVNELGPVLAKAKEQGIRSARIIDNYALAATYEELLAALEEDAGISAGNIAREEIP